MCLEGLVSHSQGQCTTALFCYNENIDSEEGDMGNKSCHGIQSQSMLNPLIYEMKCLMVQKVGKW